MGNNYGGYRQSRHRFVALNKTRLITERDELEVAGDCVGRSHRIQSEWLPRNYRARSLPLGFVGAEAGFKYFRRHQSGTAVAGSNANSARHATKIGQTICECGVEAHRQEDSVDCRGFPISSCQACPGQTRVGFESLQSE